MSRPSREARALAVIWVGALSSLGCAVERASVSADAPPPARGPAIDAASRAKLDALLAELARPPFGTGAALSVSIEGQDLSIATGTLWSDGPRATEDARWNVASVSKLLTAAKVVDLAARGRVGLDDAVGLHLPGVRLVDGDGRDRTAEVTLRRLLMHRGGLPHQPGALEPREVGSDWSDPALLTKLTTSWTITLAGEPGAYAYSNVGYALLAAIVERVEGVTFADAMDAHLRGGGMSASTFWPETLDALTAARGRVLVDGEVRFHEPAWYGSRYALPFSGLWTSTPDLVRFGRALNDASTDPAAPLHAMTRLDGEQGHGPGPVHRTRQGARSLEHDGSGPGFCAWLLAIPARRVVLAVACNGGDETREQGRRLGEVVEAMLAVVLEE